MSEDVAALKIHAAATHEEALRATTALLFACDRVAELERGLRWFLNLHGHNVGDGCEYCDRYRALLDNADRTAALPNVKEK